MGESKLMAIMDPKRMRSEFPIVEVCTYLDTAYYGPYPERSVRAMVDFLESHVTRPLPYGRSPDRMEIVERIRGKVADLLGVSHEEVFFTRSTTDGLQLVASALLKAGDELLVGGLDHPADYAVWMGLANAGVKVSLVPHRSGAMVVDDLASAIGPNTKAIGMCLVNTYNGYRQDLEELSNLCSDKGLHLLLDGIQAVGHLDIDLGSSNVTALTSGTYKWLCSPEGGGIAYVRKEVATSLRPPSVYFLRAKPTGYPDWRAYIEGVFRYGEFRSHPQAIRPQGLEFPWAAKRMELAPTILPLIGLEGMVDLLIECGGMRAVEKRVLELSTKLRSSLVEHGHVVLSLPSPKNISGITSVRVQDSQKFSQYCEKMGIYVLPQLTPVPGAQAVRVSTHVFNNEEDIAAFVEAVDSFNREEK